MPATALPLVSAMVHSSHSRLRLADVGFMLARPGAGLRVYMSPWVLQQIVDNLAALGWQEEWDELRRLDSVLSASGVGEVRFALDVTDRILPQVGLECFMYPATPWDRVPTTAFLDYLVERELCTPAKREATLAMIGRSLPRLEHLSYGRLLQGISHFKLVVEAGRLTLAKVYLYAYALR